MEPTECSETSAFNIQTPGKYPEENIPYLHINHTYTPVKLEPTECSETSAFNIRTPGKDPEENIPYLKHRESLKITVIFGEFATLRKATISLVMSVCPHETFRLPLEGLTINTIFEYLSKTF
jgi:hypothetical protein